MDYHVEYTDTFGGDANYSWVRRATVSMPDGYGAGMHGRTYRRELMRRAKAAVGITGMRGRADDFGDSIDFRPYRCATVMFVSCAE